MVNFEQLIKDIVKAIKTNGKKEITGQLLQEVLLDMVSKSQDAETESILRDNNLQDIINNIDVVLDAVNEKLAKHEGQIQDHETRIQDNASNISHNEQEIARVEGIVDGHSHDITDIKHKDAEQDAAIKELNDTTQIKDLDVEIRNTGFGWISSESAEEIYAYAIKGGNVKIQINDKKYTFVEYRQRTAYFRYLNVNADKVTEESIEIYEKTATFKTIEYKAIFDATPLLTSFQRQEPLTNEFISALDKALGEKKLIFVSGDGTIYLLIATSKTASKRSFTGFGERTAYVLSYGSNKIVSLETHTIGGDLKVFNNENSVNILNLTTESTNAEIKEVFTEAFGEVVIPHTGDIFNIYQNSDVTNSGIVASETEDAGGIRLAVDMSNFEDNLIHRVFYNIAYIPSKGLDSLNITNKVDNIINPSLLTEEKVNKRDAEIAKKADKVDVNEYNISAINGATYASLQEALTALDTYLTAKGIAKSVGVKVTYVQTDVMRAKTYSFVKMGRFTDVANWSERPLGGTIKELVLTIPDVTYDETTNRYGYKGMNDITEEEMTKAFVQHNYLKNYAYGYADFRFNLLFGHDFDYQYNSNSVDLNQAFRNNYSLEQVNFYFVHPKDMNSCFFVCVALKKITGKIYCDRLTSNVNTFGRAYLLADIQLEGIEQDWDFKDCKVLSFESLDYMVTNSANAMSPITITVHPDIFAKLTASVPDEWTALNDRARGLAITFKA